ncbi:MAG TPA: hypothetical protein PKB10_10660, partial [Tepidisphaeraceae bacterium]|nr:hypothetical protein [Tepidisphaeraceae bacterium]
MADEREIEPRNPPSPQTRIEPPADGTPLLDASFTDAFFVYGPEKHVAKVKSVDGPTPAIPSAIHVDVPSPGRRGSAVTLCALNVEPVRKGDVLLAEFWARSARSRDETAESTVNFFFEAVTPPRSDDRGHTDNPNFRSVGSPFA